MIRIGICDDSPAFLQQTKFLIDHWDDRPQGITTELFSDGDSLLQAHGEKPFDILLLDVVMPLFNGIDTAKELRETDKDVKIVFLTSSPEFAVDSYRVKASDYLLKPVAPDLLFTCLAELISQIRDDDRYLLVRGTEATHRVNLGQLSHMEAQGKYVFYYLMDGSVLRSPEPLYAIEQKLKPEDGFFKCHRSYLVNLHLIQQYSSRDILTGAGQSIPIARNYQRDFEETYFAAIFRKAGER